MMSRIRIDVCRINVCVVAAGFVAVVFCCGLVEAQQSRRGSATRQQGSTSRSQGSTSRQQGSTSRSQGSATREAGWISLFDGQSLDGWKANEHAENWKIEKGAIVLGGPRSHLFYVGPVQNHNFQNFELKLEVMTEPKANSGVYFHTKFQEKGWPDNGYESQVNNSHTDSRRTGSLYAVEDVAESPAQDNEWFEYHILVRGKQITLKINGQTMVDYTETPDAVYFEKYPQRRLSSGTFALQAHDPGSVVRYRNIRVKPLP